MVIFMVLPDASDCHIVQRGLDRWTSSTFLIKETASEPPLVMGIKVSSDLLFVNLL